MLPFPAVEPNLTSILGTYAAALGADSEVVCERRLAATFTEVFSDANQDTRLKIMRGQKANDESFTSACPALIDIIAQMHGSGRHARKGRRDLTTWIGVLGFLTRISSSHDSTSTACIVEVSFVVHVTLEREVVSAECV